MKAMLKDGKWYDVCTDCLSNYGVTIINDKGEHEFCRDEDIIQIRDDVRVEKRILHCTYCGFSGTEEEYKQHLENNKKLAHDCEHCKYWKFIIDDKNKDSRAFHTAYNYKDEITENSYVEVSHTVYRTKYVKGCGYFRWSVDSKKDCAYIHCQDYKPEDYSKGYFQQNPYGFLFKKWKYEPKNDEIKHRFSNGYNFTINVNTGDIRIWNSRREFKYNLGLTYEKINGSLYHDFPWNPKTRAEGVVGKTFSLAQDFIYEIFNFYRIYNDNLDDKYYTNPDGSPMEFAIIDGEKVYKPKKLTYTFGAKEIKK